MMIIVTRIAGMGGPDAGLARSSCHAYWLLRKIKSGIHSLVINCARHDGSAGAKKGRPTRTRAAADVAAAATAAAATAAAATAAAATAATANAPGWRRTCVRLIILTLEEGQFCLVDRGVPAWKHTACECVRRRKNESERLCVRSSDTNSEQRQSPRRRRRRQRTHDSALARHVNSSLSVSMSTASGLKSSTSSPNGSRTISTRLSERCEGCRAHNTRTRAVQQRVLTWYYKYPSTK